MAWHGLRMTFYSTTTFQLVSSMSLLLSRLLKVGSCSSTSFQRVCQTNLTGISSKFPSAISVTKFRRLGLLHAPFGQSRLVNFTQTRQRLLTGSIVPVRFQSTISPADSASSFFVHKYDNPDVQQRIAYWLFACCAIVFGIVVLGGVTRLTRSGLSMVDWKPFSILPPTSQAEWDAEFTRYQSFPEYNELGREMSLSEFKFIYFMEFSHRLAGRFLGLFFGIPAVVLGSRGLLSPSLKRRFIVLFALGGLQASVGWWMVKSGLETTAHSYNDLPRVSPYRLATHLITAFAIYSLLFTTGYRLIQSSRLLRLLQSNQPFPSDAIPSSLRISSILVAKLVGLTAFSGAFVAGNEAGLVYSDFPLMGGQWVPDDLINQHITPVWKNLFENSALVQFNHRYLGMFTAGSCAALYLLCRRIPLPPSAASASKHLIAMALLQVSLGISTLMMHVPTSLAAAHQAGSLALLTCALWLALSLRPVSVAANLVRNPAVRQAAKKIML